MNKTPPGQVLSHFFTYFVQIQDQVFSQAGFERFVLLNVLPVLLSFANQLVSLSVAAKREDEDYDEQVEEVLQDEVKLISNAKKRRVKCRNSFD